MRWTEGVAKLDQEIEGGDLSWQVFIHSISGIHTPLPGISDITPPPPGLVGDSFIAAATVAYAGPFPGSYRAELHDKVLYIFVSIFYRYFSDRREALIIL